MAPSWRASSWPLRNSTNAGNPCTCSASRLVGLGSASSHTLIAAGAVIHQGAISLHGPRQVAPTSTNTSPGYSSPRPGSWHPSYGLSLGGSETRPIQARRALESWSIERFSDSSSHRLEPAGPAAVEAPSHRQGQALIPGKASKSASTSSPASKTWKRLSRSAPAISSSLAGPPALGLSPPSAQAAMENRCSNHPRRQLGLGLGPWAGL